MTYTAENIKNIKRAGDLDDYIAHERNLIASLESAEISYDDDDDEIVSLAHLHGGYGIDVNDSPYPHNAVAYTAYSDWVGKWSVASFDGDQTRALAYARAALRNKLLADAKKLLAAARQRLAALEAGR